MIDNRLSPMFMLRRLAERDPELLIKSAAGGADSPRPSDPLLLGELDLAFGRVHDLGREHPDALDHRLIRLEPLVALLPPEHPLGDAEVIKMADIRWEGIWLPSLAGPVEWLAYLRRMSESLDVPLDDSGVSDDLRHTLERTRYGKQRITRAGRAGKRAGATTTPPATGLQTATFSQMLLKPRGELGVHRFRVHGLRCRFDTWSLGQLMRHTGDGDQLTPSG